jgi:hypothetical protein
VLLREACEICSEVMHPDELQDHKELNHRIYKEQQSRKKKIECKICGRKFLLCSLKKHVLWMHSDEEQLMKMKVTCPCCGVLLKPCNLKSHIKSIHQDQYELLYSNGNDSMLVYIQNLIDNKVKDAEAEAKRVSMQLQNVKHLAKAEDVKTKEETLLRKRFLTEC